MSTDSPDDLAGFDLAGLSDSEARARLQQRLTRDPVHFLDQLKTHLRESALRLELAHGFDDALSQATLAPRLAERLASFLAVPHGRVLLATDSEEFVSYAPAGIGLAETRLAWSHALSGQALTLGEALLLPALQANEADFDVPQGFDSGCGVAVPLIGSAGEPLGAFEAWGPPGALTPMSLQALRRLAPEVVRALERTRLVEELLRHSGYSESMLESLGSAVLTIEPDGRIGKANQIARRLFRNEALPGTPAASFFTGINAWLAETAEAINAGGAGKHILAGELALSVGGPLPPGKIERRRRAATVNLTASPLRSVSGTLLGTLLVIEDVTHEKRLRGTLARYLTSDVAERLLAEGETALGGRLLKATVMFGDIRGFTALSERLGPTETIGLLNDCFTLVTGVLLEHKGTLDKYLGDGLMAVFGAPFSSGHDAEDALCAAIAALRALRVLNLKRASETRPALRMGFGINTGEVVSGNVGSPQRMELTVVGDNVNLAARIEGANREYGTELLISEHTLLELERSYLLREVDRLRVRGRRQPLALFEVLDFAPPELLPHLRYVVSIYNEGLERYRRRDWGGALKMFAEALQLRPDDGPAQLYHRRCEYFRTTPPPEDWDGVWVLTSK